MEERNNTTTADAGVGPSRPAAPRRRSRSSRSRATSSISVRSDSSNLSSGAARLDWDSGDAYDYVQPDDQISAFLHCPICLGPFFDPYVSDSCSHTFCRQCITTALADSQDEETEDDRPHCCPTCRAPVQLADFKPTALLIKNMVDTLLVRCPNRSKGCKHTCERHLLRGHVGRDCDFEYVDEDLNEGKKCGCSEKVMRKDWSSHGLTCPRRKVQCQVCQADVRFDEMQAHCQTCSPEPATCDHCGHEATKSTLPLHLGTCPDAPVPCQHAQYGCDWIGPRWQLCRPDGEETDLLPEHARVYHLNTCRYEPLKAFLSIFTQQNVELRNENSALKRRVDELESRQRAQDRKLDDCIHSLGSWYRSAGQVGTRRRTDNQNGSVVDSDWDEFPLDVQNWDRTAPRTHLGTPSRPMSSSRSEDETRFEGQPEDRLSPLSPISIYSVPTFPSLEAPELLGGASSRHADATGRATSPLEVPLGRSTEAQHGSFPAESTLLDVDSTSLDSALKSLRISVGALANGLAGLERRNEEGHLAAVSAGFEAGRAQEEVGSLRHVVHAVRMQIHQILMQQQRHALFSPPATMGPGEGGGGGPLNPNRPPSEGQPPPVGATFNPPMLVRRWAGFDQTKL